MDLIYRTLQRPEDIIEWGPANLVKKREPDDSVQRVIRNDQAKTGKVVDIRVSADIERILASLAPEGVLVGPGMPFIHTRTGEPYTYSGISSMFRRIVYAAYKRGAISAPFGFYDLKGKGATDMWRAGVPLTLIQVLCGHESVRTTEIYVKARWRETVEPNQTLLLAVQ